MQTYKKYYLKAASQFYLAHLLGKIEKDMKQRKMMELEESSKNIPQDSMSPRLEYHFYESSVVRIMGVISSFMEATLRNGLEVDPYLMSESQDIMNSLQSLMEDKKKKGNNGN